MEIAIKELELPRDRHVSTDASIHICSDGLIRLVGRQLHTLKWRHYFTGVDTIDVTSEKCSLSGYTEWTLGDKAPQASLGWDWRATVISGKQQIESINEPRSNIMVVTDVGIDIGYEASELYLLRAIRLMHWHDEVSKVIYASINQPSHFHIY